MSKKDTDRQKTTELSDKDYEKVGKMLVSIGQLGLTDDARKKVYRMSFIKGILSGFGGVIGATIVVAILLYILSLLGEVPFIGSLSESIENTLNRAR